jgi:hypothetical protein
VKVRAEVQAAGRVHDAEALWYDTRRWSAFVDGFQRLHRVEGEWPGEGASVVWDSRPGGRGRVVERVTGWAAGDGQDLAVEDERLTGDQRVRFRGLSERELGISLELDYRLKRAFPGVQVVDFLFIRPAVRSSLQRTLTRFAIELEAEGDLSVL